MIPYGRQSVDDSDIEAVVEVLRGDWLTQGPSVARFESALVDATGAKFAVEFSSGTAALHAAAHCAGLGSGDVVYTSPLSFAASANCARYVGADVSFVDIDARTLNLDPSLLPDQVDAVVAVHYAGLPVDMHRVRARARVVIEDAAHAIGAATPEGPVGNCAHSDMCCFSFHPVKGVTTGEGGAVTTNSRDLAERLRTYRHHGIRLNSKNEPWEYDIEAVGFNYRITDIQCALGVSQLTKLEDFISRRNLLADRYRELLADVDGVQLPPAAPHGFRHAYHLFPVQVPDRSRVFHGLRERGIGVQVHYVPTYRFTAYGGSERDWAVEFPVTESVYAGLLSLPLFPALTDEEQDEVVAALKDLL